MASGETKKTPLLNGTSEMKEALSSGLVKKAEPKRTPEGIDLAWQGGEQRGLPGGDLSKTGGSGHQQAREF